MTQICSFPTCNRHPQSNGYCIGHKIYSNGVVVKKTKEISPVSDKRKKNNDVLKVLYPKFVKKNPFCKIQSPECSKIADCIHHIAGRGEDELFDQSTWKASCQPCNGYVESHDKWARDNGHKISRHQKK